MLIPGSFFNMWMVALCYPSEQATSIFQYFRSPGYPQQECRVLCFYHSLMREHLLGDIVSARHRCLTGYNRPLLKHILYFPQV